MDTLCQPGCVEASIVKGYSWYETGVCTHVALIKIEVEGGVEHGGKAPFLISCTI